MKNLKNYVKNYIKNYVKDYIDESVWDIEDNIEDNNKEFVLNEIKKFIKDNYEYINIDRCEFVLDEKKNKYIINCKHGVTLKSNSEQLTNGMFEWGVIDSDFSCMDCGKLRSLEGAPKKVGYSFECSRCEK